MNDGVKILLERMKTNPEEFVSEHGSSKWGSLIVAYKEHLDPEDRQAITEGMKIVLQQRFTERVMEELINPNKNTLKITENTIWNGASATISSASYYPTTVIPPYPTTVIPPV